MGQLLGKLISAFRGLLVRDTWRSADSCDVLFFCHDAHRGITRDGHAYAPILDSIRDELSAAGWRCASIGQADSVLVGSRAYAGPRSANRAFFAARVKSRVRGRGDAAVEALYGRIFDRTGCRCVITIGATPSMSRAARSRGVAVVEVLHGLGYTMIPWDWAERAPQDLPAAVLSLDPVSTKALSPLRDRGLIVKEIAHPWLTRFDSPAASALPNEWTRKVEVPGFALKVILVSLQWGYDGEFPEFRGIVPNGVMPEALTAAIRDTRETVFWMLRLHPIQLQGRAYARHREFVRELVRSSSNCECAEASRRPLPVLLAACDGHVTMSSMTTYEAAYSGVPTLLLCPTVRPGGAYHTYFTDLISSGYAQRVSDTSASITDWVGTATRKERVAPAARDTAATVLWDVLDAKSRGSIR